MLPPQVDGGRELTSRRSRGGATAMMPMNGDSGTSMSFANSATLRARSSLIDLRGRRREEIAEHAGAGTGIVDAVGRPQVELVDAHLQHVARRRAVHVKRAGQHMGAEPLHPRDHAVDIGRVLQHLIGRNAGGTEERRRIVLGHQALVGDRVDLHGLARLDGERRRQVRREVTPDHGLRRRAQCRVGRGIRRRRLRHHRDRKARHGPGEERAGNTLLQERQHDHS